MSGVVSNAGPLITLGKLNLLHLLGKLYHHVYISKVVYEEVIVNGIRSGCIDAFRTRLLIGDILIVKEETPATWKCWMQHPDKSRLSLLNTGAIIGYVAGCLAAGIPVIPVV